MQNQTQKLKLLGGISGGLGGLLLLSWFITTPDTLGPFGVTIWFSVLVVAASGLLTVAFYSAHRLTKRNTANLTTALRHGILVGSWFSWLLALNSLRQLDVADIVLVSVLAILIEVYLRKR